MRRMAPSHPRHSPLKPQLSQRRLRISLTFLGVLALGGCSGGVLDPKGPIGAANSLIMINSLEIMLAIFIPTIIAGCVIAWWHRSSNTRALYRPDRAYSGRLELIVWSIPIMVILLISGVIWVGSHELDPAEPIQSSEKSLNMQVVSMDWKWLFMYPEQGVASVNDLYIPAGVPVRFSLTSSTVMNMFFVPQLGSMIATMNGMVTQLHLKADHPGEYIGLSTQFSGDGFSDMGFTVHAVSKDDFTKWVEKAKAGQGPVLDRASYDALNKPSKRNPPVTYRSMDPNLFHAIATQEIPPGAGFSGPDAGPGVHPKQER
jgi:cytochrome o ubiquinol oxidase subunit 2